MRRVGFVHRSCDDDGERRFGRGDIWMKRGQLWENEVQINDYDLQS